MKAAILTGQRQLEVRQVEDPVPSEDQVVVRVALCGICGTDLNAYTTMMLPAGTILGHEFTGVVEATADPGDPLLGKRVVVRPAGACSPDCPWCSRGQVNICPHHLDTTLGLRIPGAFAEKVAVPRVQVYPLEDHVTFEEATLTEPLAVGIHGVNRINYTDPGHIWIFGGGTVGLMCLAVVRHRYPKAEITLVEPIAARRRLGQELGADRVLDPSRDDVAAAARSLPLQGPDVVLECAGIPAVAMECAGIVAQGGQVVLLGVGKGDIQLDYMKTVIKGMELTSSIGYEIPEFEQSLELVSSGALPLQKFIHGTRPLDTIAATFDELLDRPEVVAKVMIDPRS